MKTILKPLVLFLFISIGGVYTLQRAHDANFPKIATIEDFKYLPSGTFLKGAALSFDEVLADLLWIKTISYFGEHYHKDKNYKWLYRILDVTTTLDPLFQDPYEFGGIILASELNDIDDSTKLLKKGMKNVSTHHKRYWYLPFFTAFNYMYYYGDNRTAAHYLEIATTFPQSPSYLPLLVARLYANTNDPGVAIPFLRKMIERAATPEMKIKLTIRIKEIQIKQHIQLLTALQKRFFESTGRELSSLNELVSHKFIPEIPQEPFGGFYFISKDDNSIQSSSETDNMDLHIATGPFSKKKRTKKQ